jgi:hypothetical protein
LDQAQGRRQRAAIPATKASKAATKRMVSSHPVVSGGKSNMAKKYLKF